jgi:hypothetical protein
VDSATNDASPENGASPESDMSPDGDASPGKWPDEQWAQLVLGLGPDERARRTQAVDILLDKPEEISDPLETELYLLRDQLQKTA